MRKQRFWQFATFSILLLLGLLVFVVFSHMRPIFSGIVDQIGRLVLILGFLIAFMITKKNKLKAYSGMLYAFFIACFAMAIDLYLPSSLWIRNAFHISIETPQGIALDKFDSSLIIIISILVLSKLNGKNLSDLYIRGENVKIFLSIGVIAFLIAASLSYFIANLFGALPYTLLDFIPWIPFILIFIIGNAFNEELLFRGVFLKDYGKIMNWNLVKTILRKKLKW